MNEMTAIVDSAPAVTPGRLPPMPPEIAKAIVVVMGQIKRLEKEGTNSFQRYQYTSVDQFFEAVGPLMAEAGIFTLAIESEMEVEKRETTDDQGRTKTAMWLLATYDIWLFHATGSSFGPISRSIQVPASGAQSYASAMSFVEKYFLRSLFKIPTGDADADADDKRGLPSKPNGARPPPKPSGPAMIDDDQMRELGRLITACGKGTWEQFAEAMKVARLGDIPASKFEAACQWLQAVAKRHSNGNGAKTPPNPNKPASPPSQSQQAATGPVDFDALRIALNACETLDAANLVFEREATNRTPQLGDDDLNECDAVLRECTARFWRQDAAE